MKRLLLMLALAAPAVAQHDAGLVGHWLWPGGSYNATVNNRLGGYAGIVSGTAPEPITNSYWFGTNGTASPRLGTNNVLAGAAALTISAWVRDLSASGAATKDILTRFQAGQITNQQVYWFYAGTTPGLYVYGQAGTPTATNWYRTYCEVALPAANRSITNRLWHHVVATWAGTTNIVRWQNGVKFVAAVTTDGSGGAVTNIGSNAILQMNIGATAIASRSWVGIIDDLRLYNRVLSDAEILALYNDGRAAGRVP